MQRENESRSACDQPIREENGLLSSLLLRFNSRQLPKNVMRETGRCTVVGSLNFTENSCYL